MEITSEEKIKLGNVAEKYGLKFIIAYGSFVTGKHRDDSDLDIAVLGHKEIDFKDILEIHGKLADIFGDNKTRELDLKELHHADSLFRYLVVRDGILLFGNTTEYNEFKAYVARDFELAQDLFLLEEVLIKKQNKLILSHA